MNGIKFALNASLLSMCFTGVLCIEGWQFELQYSKCDTEFFEYLFVCWIMMFVFEHIQQWLVLCSAV